MKPDLIVILGSTAVGKTRLAAKLADKFNGEIISADSRQVYRRMDIGTGKDREDYIVDGKKINHYLVDVVEPTEEFDLFRFVKEFNNAFENITAKKKLPFLTGGTGLYLHAVLTGYELSEVSFNERREELEGFSEEELKRKLLSLKNDLHNITDLTDKGRMIKAIIIAEEKDARKIKPLKHNAFVLGVAADRKEIKKRITERLNKRLEEGMIEEVEILLKNGISYDKLFFFGLEYRYIALYLKGELNYNDMYQKLNSEIYKFAKRQMTWFRKMEREGIKINWINSGNLSEAEKLLRTELEW